MGAGVALLMVSAKCEKDGTQTYSGSDTVSARNANFIRLTLHILLFVSVKCCQISYKVMLHLSFASLLVNHREMRM